MLLSALIIVCVVWSRVITGKITRKELVGRLLLVSEACQNSRSVWPGSGFIPLKLGLTGVRGVVSVFAAY